MNARFDAVSSESNFFHSTPGISIKSKLSTLIHCLPGFPVSTAPGHAGQFVAGQLAGKNVLCMQGRFHYYEGHDMAAIALPVWVFKALGCRALVLTNAAGGVNWDFNVGDIMLHRFYCSRLKGDVLLYV